MTNIDASKWLIDYIKTTDLPMPQYEEAMLIGIKALDKISLLKDRPCSACEYHKENGCSKWDCVFD